MIKLVFLFILVYAILYFLGQFTDLHAWGKLGEINLAKMDYMFFLIPIPGFFFMYLLVDWVEKYYKTTLAHSIIFPIIFVVVSFIAYYVTLYWYWQNLAQLGGVTDPEFITQRMNYIPTLLDSAYLVFILAAIGGWVSKVLLDRLEGSSESNT